MTIRGKTAIVGIHEYESRFDPLATEMSIEATSTRLALEDAGLTKDDIDAVFSHHGMELCEYMDLNPKVVDTTNVGGGSYEFHVAHAAAMISMGQCEVAVITYGSKGRSGRRSPGPQLLPPGPDPFESTYGVGGAPTTYSQVASRHMYEYGTTSEQLAEIAVQTRQHASTNPFAVMREPMTVQDVLNSRMIADPLHLLDCCLVTDGGGAFIMTSAERAKTLRKKPVYVLGVGTAVAHGSLGNRDLTTVAAAQSAPRAFAEAGVKHKDIDLAMVYDSFTITVLCTLEDLGFCAKGEGGSFVEGGTLSITGKLPTNTDGGGLSSNHPGQRGIFLIFEAVRQLRGEREGNQVANCNIALCHGTGGSIATRHSGGTVILSTEV